MKESLVAVIFNIEKASDNLWREGVLIKLNSIGIGGKFSNRVLDFVRVKMICQNIALLVAGCQSSFL